MRSLSVVIILQGIFKICLAYENTNSTEYLNCFRKICIPSDYDNLSTPITVVPTQINVDFFYLQLLKIDDYDCTITVKFLLQLHWVEPRLKLLRNAINYVTLPREFIESIWMPNTYVDHVRSIETYNLIHDFDGLMYTENKTLLYYIDVEVVFSRNFCQYIFLITKITFFRLYFIVP